jgi:hypothetical protein
VASIARATRFQLGAHLLRSVLRFNFLYIPALLQVRKGNTTTPSRGGLLEGIEFENGIEILRPDRLLSSKNSCITGSFFVKVIANFSQ